jgi:hypothetical protein
MSSTRGKRPPKLDDAIELDAGRGDHRAASVGARSARSQ